MTNILNSMYVVPVAGCLMVLGLGVAGIYSEVEQKRIRAQQRMAMLQRGLSADEIEKLLGTSEQDSSTFRDPLRSLGNSRRTATVLISSGIGIAIVGLLLTFILHHRVLLTVSAGGIIPIAIGVGFLFDYRMQARELARFGLEVNPDAPTKN